MIACAGIVPLALICGPVRGIPFWWTVIDMSVGVFGVIPLYVVQEEDQAPGDAHHERPARPRYLSAARAIRSVTGFMSSLFTSVPPTETTSVCDRFRVAAITVP
ncbi:hypothetical protein SALBM311S_00493 [Streptomyces alboniger]